MTSKHHPEPSSWSSRPHFAPRQLLTAEQLNAGLQDELDRQRRLSRAIHGYGVVVGFALTTDDDGDLDLQRGCPQLSAGLALDRHGRMLNWGGGRLGLRDLVGEQPDCEGRYTLFAHYAVRPPAADGCPPVSAERDRWSRQGVVFTLRPGCHELDRDCVDHPPGACPSHAHYLCRRTGGLPGHDPGDIPVDDDVAWFLSRPGPTCPIDRGGWEYDPDHSVAVPIACVEICDLTDDRHGHGQEHEHDRGQEPRRPRTDPDCDPCYGFCRRPPEVCRVRPFVYRNPLLYELASCCDVELAGVRSISWQEWIDSGWSSEVPWDEFERRITSTDSGFEIWFTRPIQVATINHASVFLTAVVAEDRTDYWMPQRVPLRDLVPLDRHRELASGVRLVPTSDWLSAEVTGRRSTLFDGARFELTVRGQLMRDECDQMLDARPLDIAGGARCQARPGDDFVSAFRVAARHRAESSPEESSEAPAPTIDDSPQQSS